MARHRPHFFTVLHLLLFAALALIAWRFFWLHDCEPALREIRQLKPKGHLLERLTATAEAIGLALAAIAGDFLAGLSVLVLLFIGTRLPVARLVTWVQARSSGDGVSLGGKELSDEAVLANERKGSVLR